MAEVKTIELHIKSNVDTASKEFDNFAKSIKAVDKSATNLDATFEEVYGDLQPLTTRMGEAEDRLYELALAGQQSSQEFRDLLTSVGNYRRVQIQTDMVVDNAATTMSQKLGGALNFAAGSFSLVQGSMSLFGAESENVEKAILKVQEAMAISQGVETMVESAKSVRALGTAIQSTTAFQKISAAAQYVWNAAMSANPIGALVVAIGALLVGGYKLVKFFKDSSDANEKAANSTRKNTAALKEQSTSAAQSSNKLKTYNDQQYALAQASGASNEELRKLALKHKEEEIALNKKNTVLAQSTFLRQRDTLAALKNSGASDEVIANQEKLTQETYKAFKKQNEILSNSYKERAALRNSSKVGEVADEKARLDEIREKNKTAYEKRLEDQKEAAKKAKEEREKAAQEERDFFIGIDKVQREQRVSAALQKVEDDAKVLSDATAVADALNAAQEEKDNRALEKKKKAAEDEVAFQKSKDEAIANSKANLNNIIAGLESSGLSKTKAGQVISKSIALTQIGIDSAVAISKASTLANAEGVAAQLAFPLVPGIGTIARVVSYASTAASVIGNISRARQLLSSGSAGGGTSSSGGGSSPAGGTAPVAAAPTFNVVGTSGQNQIAQSLGNQAPVKAYVLSNDVTTAQSLDRNIVKTATLGN